MHPPAAIRESLSRFGQEHLLRFWSELDSPQRQQLVAQVESIDLALVERLIRERSRYKDEARLIRERAERAAPPTALVRQPRTVDEQPGWLQACEIGESRLRDGRVACVVVAGGQGSRLGFDKPKGMFPIGPVTERSLFQLFCEQLQARTRRYGRRIPYLVMTSDATHQETVKYFAEQRNFGLPDEDVRFFQQGALPAVDEQSGRILMSAPDELSLSPDGHGGILKALARAGLLAELRTRGIETLFYHQVDNPTAILCDPAFLGLHHRSGSQMSTKVAAKESAAEKMGVVVSVDDQTQIIEYSDLPADRAQALAADGSLLLWAGNTAIHAFETAFLELVLAGGGELPYHFANKAVPCIDETGQPRTLAADEKNGVKFEQFIFDVLLLARTALVVECDRSREFNPVKNATGKDSPDTARAALLQQATEFARDHGATVADDAQVELSPLWADSVADNPTALIGQRLSGPTVLG